MSNKYFIIPIFVPHLGCPHDCVFCNQKRITGLSTNVGKKYVKEIIEKSLRTVPENKERLEVAFYGGSFTAIDKVLQEDLLSIPYSYKEKGLIDEIRLSTRPDYINIEILNLLKNYGVDTIELGVQSLDKNVLMASGRGHTDEDVYRAIKLIKDYNFKLGLQMMIGLPRDNKSKSLYTAKQIIKEKPNCVRIYPTLVIRDTYLEKLYLNGDYTPLLLEEAVNISAELLMLFEYFNINVIRVGLQPTEKITLGQDVIAGPFHPSFRQLVESYIYKIIFDSFLNKIDTDEETLIIEANNKEISNISGQKSKNIDYIKEKFNIKKVKIYAKNLPKNILNINIGDLYDTINRREIIEDYLIENGIIYTD